MSREKIISEIRRLATELGEPPGSNKFRSETGISRTQWYGKYWSKWSEALADAGFSPNSRMMAIPETDLLDAIIDLSIQLEHFPSEGELRLAKNDNSSFPSHSTIHSRLGRKPIYAKAVLARAKERNIDPALLRIFEVEAESALVEDETEVEANTIDGFVYLLKSGRYYKIGKTNSLDRRQYEVGLQMPEGVQPIHSIKTDDPSGIEAYWHRRFKDKRLNGEWFNLSKADVSAFRKRKFM